MEALVAQSVPGSDGAVNPFWSADGRSLGFFANGELKTIDMSSGSVATLCDGVSRPSTVWNAGTWNRDDVILFSDGGRLHRVSASGDDCTPLAVLETRGEQGSLLFPAFLPDGQHFLYLDLDGGPASEDAALYVAPLDGGDPTLLRRVASNVTYAGGRLFFRPAGGRLLQAQPFDATRFRLAGGAVTVADQVESANRPPRAVFTVSDRVLAYLHGVDGKTQFLIGDLHISSPVSFETNSDFRTTKI